MRPGPRLGTQPASKILPLNIVLATRNHKKTEEMRRILAGTPVLLQNLTDFPSCPEVEEDGLTFQDNAAKKALHVARFTGLLALADDSGLVVDCLGGAPGVLSARYAGPHANDADNLHKLLVDVRACLGHHSPQTARTARFECVLSLARPDGWLRHFQGSVAGHIIDVPRGTQGFGYDPAFVPDTKDQTFAEMSGAQKDAISHRGRALAAFAGALHEWVGE
ncbi:MAG: RdgB/HAM1 family non-canonical purine NTP pyrophosphatase [Magnetococcales bacterium]|nr:RdgB/HAM1 family non-canonical purine NTP pyrophosphatase [Magnetococcales bacterium]